MCITCPNLKVGVQNKYAYISNVPDALAQVFYNLFNIFNFRSYGEIGERIIKIKCDTYKDKLFLQKLPFLIMSINEKLNGKKSQTKYAPDTMLDKVKLNFLKLVELLKEVKRGR